MKEMFTRTQFAVDQGGYFPEIKVCIVIGYHAGCGPGGILSRDKGIVIGYQAVDQGGYFPDIKVRRYSRSVGQRKPPHIETHRTHLLNKFRFWELSQ